MPEAIAEIRTRDLEEQQRALKERILLVSKTFLENREQETKSRQEIQKNLLQLNTEMQRIQETVKNITEQLNKTARREELATIQRQLDLLRTHGT